MPDRVVLPLVGPSNRIRSVNLGRSINLLAERATPGNPKVPSYLRKRPGRQLALSTGEEHYQSGTFFYQDGRWFAISQTQFLELFVDDEAVVTSTSRGTVNYDGLSPATICSNGSAGNQLFITAGSLGYTFDLNTNVLAQITDPDFPANVSMGEFFGGYFLVLVRDSRQFRWSALEDGTSWDPLDVAERSWGSDNIAFLKRQNTQIWLGGTKTSEVWQASGDITVFAPIGGALLEFGCVAGGSCVRFGNTLAWLSQDERGGGQVIKADGYDPSKISVYAIDTQIQAGAGQLGTAVGIAMQIDGHDFLLFQIDPLRTTPTFDLAQGEWHDWAIWNPTTCRYDLDVTACHAYAFERHYIGDRRTGAIYEVSFAFYDDKIKAA